jgi:nucleotide-binding universal stress UspA family protein
VNSPPTRAPSSPASDDAAAIRRLLFVSDIAVAHVDELPPAVRVVIDAADTVNVLSPALPGRLAWLADDVDWFRDLADERLNTVLDHMHSIGARATGAAIRGSLLTVIADAAGEFEPDHILIAVHVSDHANWQEHKLIEHVAQRFGVPVTTFAVDRRGRTSPADGPVVLCYDGSEDARRAIEYAGRLLDGRTALVVTVWQPTSIPEGLGFAGASDGMVDFVELDRAAAERGRRVADAGVHIARRSGLRAEPAPIKATGRVWETIIEFADRHDAAMIVMGSRGLTGLTAMVRGGVSSALVHHADRPTLLIRQPRGASRLGLAPRLN